MKQLDEVFRNGLIQHGAVCATQFGLQPAIEPCALAPAMRRFLAGSPASRFFLMVHTTPASVLRNDGSGRNRHHGRVWPDRKSAADSTSQYRLNTQLAEKCPYFLIESCSVPVDGRNHRKLPGLDRNAAKAGIVSPRGKQKPVLAAVRLAVKARRLDTNMRENPGVKQERYKMGPSRINLVAQI
jgi:hypothetical protein